MLKKQILQTSLLPLALLFTLMIAATAEAKEGFYLGAEMVFLDIGGTVDSGGTISSGDGAGVTAGYGISRNFAFEASFQSTQHTVTDGRNVDLTAGLIGVKASIQLKESHIEPYLVLGIGKYSLDTRRGDGWRCGAGLDIQLVPAFSFTIGIARHFIDLDPAPKVSGDVTSMNIGIAYHFL
jgi:hypothetical protein